LKNANAVALGRLGGLAGGPARAVSLTSKKRKEIARLGGTARWMRRLRTDRVYRRKVAEGLAKKHNVDPGDVEHSLYSLTLPPAERLLRCLARPS